MTIRTIPTDAFTRQLVRIDQLIAAQQLQEASSALNTIQHQNPRDPRLYLLGMKLARAAGNPRGELEAARRAVALSPGWPVALMELALVLSSQQQHAAAIEQARLGVTLSPHELDVLTRAVIVAANGDHTVDGIDWARRALKLQPTLPEVRFSLASFLLNDDQVDEARTLFEALLDEFPDSPRLHIGLLLCGRALEDAALEQRHADALLAAEPDNGDYQYLHAVAHGETPASLPSSSLTQLFDNYADRFDMHLVRRLQYRVPDLVAQRLLELHPDRKFNLLDLGCGTGLLAIFLGPIEGHIIGVDLSEKMLEQAARTQLYSRLHQVNILDALRDTPSAHYEAIACNDVLIYVGTLTDVIPGAWRILKPGGHFIFSCETAAEDEADLVLRSPTNRYAHKASHVEHLCRQAGFDDIRIEHLEQLRMENHQPLPGFLVTARKPTDVATS